MIQVWMLILSAIVFEAHASDFNYIKLNPQFEQYLTQPKLKSAKHARKSLSASSAGESSPDEYAQKSVHLY